MNRWSLIVAANDDAVLEQTLLRSPDIVRCFDVTVQRQYNSAGTAFNAAIDDNTNEILVFAHQDVYLPAGWRENLASTLRYLTTIDPTWGVLGVYGITPDGRGRGHIFDVGARKYLGAPLDEPILAQSLDEIVLVIRRSSGLRFDGSLPGFHFYGTDICLLARQLGLNSYIVSNFCVHNTDRIRYFTSEFWRGYLHMRRKWWRQLPIQTTCTLLTRPAWPMVARLATDLTRRLSGPAKDPTRYSEASDLLAAIPLADSELTARHCGNAKLI